jgi:predicted outer membrane lipoprotein
VNATDAGANTLTPDLPTRRQEPTVPSTTRASTPAQPRSAVRTNVFNVVRMHLVDRYGYTLLPWGILALVFGLTYAIFAVVHPPSYQDSATGGLSTLFIFVTVIGVQAATRTLPFAMSLGITRRSYFLGTWTLGILLSAVFAVIQAALTALEQATDGWGVNLRFFAIPWLFDGPWYETVASSFVLLMLFMAAGMWSGLIHKRWGVPGNVVFFAGWAVLAAAAIMVITWRGWWGQVGRFLAEVSMAGVIAVLAGMAVVALAGTYLTIRRIVV